MFPSLVSFTGLASVLNSFSDGIHYGLSTDFYFIVLLYCISIFMLNFDRSFFIICYTGKILKYFA